MFNATQYDALVTDSNLLALTNNAMRYTVRRGRADRPSADRSVVCAARRETRLTRHLERLLRALAATYTVRVRIGRKVYTATTEPASTWDVCRAPQRYRRARVSVTI